MEEFNQETTKSHFSHPHPLKLIVYKQTLNLPSPPCSGCKLKPSGMLYSCIVCQDYSLHKNCFEMPKKLTHPFHKIHPHLILMPKPPYNQRHFRCDACRERGDGFSYHCKRCGINLHMLCAIMPLSLTHDSHVHMLNLTFESPYSEKKFSCDICMSLGSRQWLYRCKSCGFDAHIKCVMGFRSKDRPVTREAPTSSRVSSEQSNEMAIEAIQQMIINNSRAIAQAILSANESGDNRGFHLLIQLISALNNNTGTSGGGGGQDSLQETVMDCGSDDGGTPDSFKAVMDNGGGGGSQDSLQVVNNGGGGGGGSLPEKITHPFDKKHALALLSEPAYSKGHFRCDACKERGNGYSYHCQHCGIDLHVSCAMLPLSVAHDSHVHTLCLVFESPYTNNKFPCDICLRPGSRQWLYRCKSCGFNAHIKCAVPGDVPHVMNSGFPGGVLIQNMIVNNGANTAMAEGLMRLISNGVTGGGGGGGGGIHEVGGGDYEQLLFGDGNSIDFLAGLFGG